MKELIEKLEAAAEGGGRLDADIMIACRDGLPEGEAYKEGFGRVTVYLPDGGKHIARAPHYTTSIDVALTLVLKGWDAMVNTEGRATVYRRDVHAVPVEMYQSYGNTPALALCIANLRARIK